MSLEFYDYHYTYFTSVQNVLKVGSFVPGVVTQNDLDQLLLRDFLTLVNNETMEEVAAYLKKHEAKKDFLLNGTVGKDLLDTINKAVGKNIFHAWSEGDSSLHAAIITSGKEETIKLLIKEGAIPNLPTCAAGNMTPAERLEKAINNPKLDSKAKDMFKGYLKIIDEAEQKLEKATESQQGQENSEAEQNVSLDKLKEKLYTLSNGGYLKELKDFYDKVGQDVWSKIVNAEDAEGSTALHFAIVGIIGRERAEIVKFLLEHGADPEVKAGDLGTVTERVKEAVEGKYSASFKKQFTTYQKLLEEYKQPEHTLPSQEEIMSADELLQKLPKGATGGDDDGEAYVTTVETETHGKDYLEENDDNLVAPVDVAGDQNWDQA